MSEIIHKLNYLRERNDYISDIRTSGMSVIPNAIDKEECDRLCERADRLLEEHPEFISMESGNSDSRVYGIDRADASLVPKKLTETNDRFVSAFDFGGSNSFVLFNRIRATKENLGSGGGWHRDSPFTHQFKCIAYLSDVSEDNGPFQYIEGTHTYAALKRISGFLGKPLNDYRFSEAEISKLVKEGISPEPKKFAAKKGTIILVDTRGLHRGMPLKSGSRYAMTYYNFKGQIPESLKKNLVS